MKSDCIAVDALLDKLNRDIDLFVCSVSYESRCRTVADQLDPFKVHRAIVAESEHAGRYVTDNGSYLRERFGASVMPITTDPGNPVTTADALQGALRTGRPEPRGMMLVDITTFTHEALLILAKILSLEMTADHALFFVYVGAAEYSVGEPDERKWLSKGVSEVRSVLGFPGVIVPSRRQHLIILVGFEHERAAELIRSYEPSVVSLGHGRSGTALDPGHQAANQRFHKLVSESASTYGDVKHFEFACNDPLDAQRAIEKQARAVKGHNTVVAPMNTKLSTLGAVLAAQRDESIQLCYARANQYNYERYSRPGDTCYLIELPELFEQT